MTNGKTKMPKRSFFKKKPKKFIRRNNPQEIKTLDTAPTITASSTGQIFAFSNIPQGADMSDRIGRSVFARTFEVRGQMIMVAAAVTTYVRVIIYIDHDLADSGTLPAVTSVLEIANIISLRNNDPNFLKRFKILKDDLVPLVAAGNNQAVAYHAFVRINNTIKFTGVAATDSAQGTVCMLFISDQAVNVPTVNMFGRLRYTDA